MPSRRSRSRSNERSRSPERRADLPTGVSPISESHYFQKSDEFRLWLKEEKGKVCRHIWNQGIAMSKKLIVFDHCSFFFWKKKNSTSILCPVIEHAGKPFPTFFFFFSRANRWS